MPAVSLIGPQDALWLAVLAAALSAFFAYRRALRADSAKTGSDVWLGVGNALLAGGALALVLFILQQSFRDDVDRARGETEFLSRVAMTADLTGFDPPPTARTSWTGGRCVAPTGADSDDERAVKRLAGWSLAAKDLEGARLDGMRLEGTSFRDARLVGATLTCADMREANLQRADLHGAVLTGADLSRADLRGARLDGAIWDVRRWGGARVDLSTCWPSSGPWRREPRGRWMKERGIEPRTLGTRGRAYGHLCDDAANRVIRGDRTRSERHVPPAIGRTDVYEERQWREDVLRTLRQLVRKAGRVRG